MKITVRAGPHPRNWCPVHATLPATAFSSSAALLREDVTGQVVPCQLASSDRGGSNLFWILDSLDANAERNYTLEESPSSANVPGVHLKEGNSQIDVIMDDALFTSYRFSASYARPFLYPVMGPFAHGITRNYPMVENIPGETSDHPHHKSLYTAFGDVNGLNDWDEVEEDHGRIVHQAFEVLEGGPVYGRIVARNNWVTHDGKTVVRETRDMVFYHTPAESRVADYAVTFHAGDEAVTFGDTKEGGILSVRVATSMDVGRGLGGQITNAYGGTNEAETWGKPSPWCDYSGPVAGRTVGLAILDHPGNLRYPTQWHVRNYGLMTANCFGWSCYQNDKSLDGSYTIAPHTDLTFRYRIYIHSGGAGQVPSRFLDFAFPPQVSVKPSTDRG